MERTQYVSSNEKSLVGSEWREWWGRMMFDGSGEREAGFRLCRTRYAP